MSSKRLSENKEVKGETQMFGMLNPYETIEEGPVVIRFEESKKKRDRIKVDFIVDFGKTDLSPEKASTVLLSIVNILRLRLGVSLPKCK